MPAGIQGMAVATCYSGADNTGTLQDNYVVGVIDVHNPVGPGAFWPAPMYHGPANSWKANRLGQVFGIAIDKRNNVFLTPTTCYPNYSPSSPLYFGSAGPGGIYKLDGVTGSVSDLVTSVPYNNFGAPSGAIGTTTLPNGNGSNSGPGIGNICYSRNHDRLYLTNHEDGTIYRVNPLTGVVDALYDPVAPASPGTTTNPAMTADSITGGTMGYAPLGDQLWGIAYNPVDNRIYYSVWVETSVSNAPGTRNVIRSVQLDASGNFLPAMDQLEVELPDYTTNNWSMPVADIAFPSEGNAMLVAERGMSGFGGPTPHASRVLKYTRTAPASPWNAPTTIWIGAGNNTNAAGGVDYGYGQYDPATGENLDCDSVIWATGDFLHNASGFGMMYGLQRTPVTGNTPGTVGSTGYFIDLDGIASTFFYNAKTNIGDVEIFRDSCGAVEQSDDPCDKIRISAKPGEISDTSCCWILGINGLPAGMFTSVSATILTDSTTFSAVIGPSGWGVTNGGTSASWAPMAGPLPAGTVDSLIFCLYSLVDPPQEIEIVLHTADGRECRDTIRVDCQKMPPPVPSCLVLSRERIECRQTGPNGSVYDFSFVGTNYSPFSQAPWNYPAENILAYSITPGITLTPGSVTFPPLGYGASTAPLNFTITGGNPGDTVCIVLQLHGKKLNVDYQWCCPPDTICYILPPCKDCCDSVDISMRDRGVRQIGNTAVNVSSTVSVTPGPVVSASATIMSVTRSTVWCPKFQPGQGFTYVATTPGGPMLGQITNATISPTIPVSSGILPPTSQVTWGTVPAGVPMTGGNVGLQISLPGSTLGWRCRDTLTICVRYSYTDTACRTCDTVVYYTVPRTGRIEIVGVPHEGLPVKSREGIPLHEESGTTGENPLSESEKVVGPDIDFEMTSADAGTLALTHWWKDDLIGEPGTRLVEMQVEAGGGAVVTGIEDASGTPGRVIDRRGVVLLDLKPRETDEFRLTFDIADRVRSFPIYVSYRYIESDQAKDTIQSGVYALTARIPGESGGDIVANDTESERPKNVRTYMLYFANNNLLRKPVARVDLKVTEGGSEERRILAVGPPNELDPTRVSLSFVERVSGAGGTAPEGEVDLVPANHNTTRSNRTQPVAPGDSVIPIIVTISGIGEEAVNVEYTTYDEEDNVISTGSIALDDPLVTMAVPGGDKWGQAGARVQLFPVAPNPGNGDRTVRFALSGSESDVTIGLYDAGGREVRRIVDGRNFVAGTHRLIISSDGLAGGTYYVVLKTADEQISTPITVLR